MTWSDPRPSARPGDSAPRRGLAHTDDAKLRSDETTLTSRRDAWSGRRSRGRLLTWAVPVLVALAVAVIIGGAAAIGGDDSQSPSAQPEPSPSPTPAPPGSPTTSEPPTVLDLSGTYRGTAVIDSASITTGEQLPTRTEDVLGQVVCDANDCLVQVEYLTNRFRRPITLPAAGGTDRFSRPAQGGDPCNRTPGVSVEARADGWVRLGPSGLEWKLVNHADKYTDCPGGVFVGGSVSTGTATRD